MLHDGDVDWIDGRLVSLLMADGRAAFAELGEQVGLSAPAVKRRVDRLRAAGTVRGFTAVVDPAAMGWTTEAYVLVFCTRTIAPTELKRAWEHVPEVVAAATVTGAADAMLHLRAADNQHLERAIAAVRSEPTVHHTESVIVLSRLFERGA